MAKTLVHKRCHEKGCADGLRFASGQAATARCAHEWYVRVMVNGRRERGPVSKYRYLLRPGEPLPATKLDAIEFAGRVRTWLVTGETPPTAPDRSEPPSTAKLDTTPRLRIAEAVAVYQQKHIAKMSDTGAAYLAARIAADVGTRPITDLLDAGVIGEWLADLAEDADGDPRAASTLNRYRARWSHLITFCRIEYALTGPTPFYHPILNPVSRLRRLKEASRKRRLKTGEEARLIRACTAQADGGVMLGRLYCGLDAGLRRREMLLVDLDHLQRDRNGVSIVIPAAHAKGRKERAVPVTSQRLLKFLQRRQQQLARAFGQPREPRFVFGQRDGTRVDSFRSDWEAVQIAAGLRAGEYRDRRWVWTHEADLHWHDLRHECGSRLAQGTAKTPPVPLRDIQEMLGHAKLATTEIYLNTSHESVARNMRRVHRALGI